MPPIAATPERLPALGGLLLAAGLGYLILLHWWFTAPMLAMGQQIVSLRDQELVLRMEATQRKELENKLAQVRTFEAGNPGFLPEANRELASAGLVQRLKQIVGNATSQPNACQIMASTPAPAESQSKEPFARVVIQVRLRCGMSELTKVLHALESGSQQLFVDNLELLSRRSYLASGAEASALDVSFNLFGYLKSASGDSRG